MLHNMMNTVAQRENHHSHPQESGSCFNDGFTPYPSQTQQQQSRSQQPRSQQQQQSQSAAPQATLTAAHQSILSQLYQVNSSNPVYAPSIATPYPLFIDIHTGATIRLSEMAPSRPAAGARSEEGSATQQQQQTGGEGAGAVPEQFRYTGPQRSRTETALFHQQQQQNNAAGLSPAAMAWQPMQQQQPSITVGARRVPMPIHNNNPTASTPHHTAQSLSSFTVGGAHASYPSSTPPSSTNSTQQQAEPATVAKPTIAASLEQLQQSTSPTTTNSNNMTTPSRPTKRPTSTSTTTTVEPSEADTQTPARRTMAKGNNNSPATTQAKHAGTATTATTTPSTTAPTTATATTPNGPTYHYELVGRYRRFVATGTASFDEGTPVILEGDRGVDLAIVRSCSRRTHALMPRNYHTQGPKAIPAVLQAATSEDVARWEALRSDELDALEECQRCIAFNGMQNEMTVVNAVFQFDKQKLTFFYQTRAPRVDFRKLLNELFTKFRCRIWMEKDEEDQ